MAQQNETVRIRNRFEKIDTANVSDILDSLGVTNQGLSSAFSSYSGERIYGWAYTIFGSSMPYLSAGDDLKMQACNGIGPAEVSVWAGDGQGICYFGELIALGMQEKGSVGALVEGGVRDIKWLQQHEYPVFAKYRTPVQSITRWKVQSYQQDVYVEGATTSQVKISPGDFILADQDGAVVIPREHVSTVLDRAEVLTSLEIKIRQHLRTGASLAECLQKYGHV